MKTALIGGTSDASSRWRPTSMMLRVRVPSGTRSGRARRRGVFGNAKDAPLTSPPPGTPNFPPSAGSAKIARMPLPPFWLRSSPLPTLIAAGASAWYHSASARMSPSDTPQTRAASETLQRRARAMNSSNPSTWRSTNARSIPSRRSSSAATAQANTTSVPGRSAMWRSARRAITVRRGSTTTSLALALGAHAPERRAEAAGAVDERRVCLGHLRAEHAAGVRVRVRAADGDDAVVLDRDGEAARVGAVERADARSLDSHGRHRTRTDRLREGRNALRRGREAGDVMGEIFDVRLAQRLDCHRHRPVEVSRSLSLVGAEQPQEVLEVLAGEARHLLLAAEVRSVTRGAVVGGREPLPRGGRRRQGGDDERGAGEWSQSSQRW